MVIVLDSIDKLGHTQTFFLRSVGQKMLFFCKKPF